LHSPATLAPDIAGCFYNRGPVFVGLAHHGVDFRRAHFQLALVRLEQKDHTAALSHLEQLRRLDPADKKAVELIKKLRNQR